MRNFISSTIVLFVTASACSVSSASVVFVFDNNNQNIGYALDGLTTGMFTDSSSGLTMTATVISAGVFNVTSSYFGINQSTSGDDTDRFDNANLLGLGDAEGMTISFDQDVVLENIDVSSFSTNSQNPDIINIAVGATTVSNVIATGTTSLGQFAVSAGTDITILTTGGTYGNGWSLDIFKVRLGSTVPEPISFFTFLMPVGLACGCRRRQCEIDVANRS